MTALILWIVLAVGAPAAAILTVTRSTRRSRYAAQVTPRDERGPDSEAVAAHMANLAKQHERRHP